MKPALRRFRDRVHRRLRSITGKLKELLAALKPQSTTLGSQRMCPSCGLITPRSLRLCLECGESLGSIQLERKDARQG